MPVGAGDVIAGKYELERQIGEGGMGLVWAARHVQLDQRVAVKLLSPAMMQNEEVASRFVREALAAVKIKNPHVARVTDVGKTDGGVPFLVMEYLEGDDLAALIESAEPFPIPRCADIVLQTCEAIAEAHSLGIIHRDLKPANLFVTRQHDGRLDVKVLDFGISKLSIDGAGPAFDQTQTSVSLGSPLYMSPEHIASTRDVDARTDIWALGVILYEMTTRRPPFSAAAIPQLCAKILLDEPVPPRELRPDVPEAYEAVILRCLRKDRNKRYRHVGELAMALSEFAPKRARQSAKRAWTMIEASSRPDARDRDSGASVALAPPPLPAARLGDTSTNPGWNHPTPPPPAKVEAAQGGGSSAALLLAGAAIGAVLVAGVLVFQGRVAEAPSVAPAATAEAPVAAPTAPAPTLPAAIAPAPAVEPKPAASATPVASASAAAAPRAPSKAHASAPPVSPPAPATPPPAARPAAAGGLGDRY